MRDVLRLSETKSDRMKKIMNYAWLNEEGMFYKGLATPTNLMKCLWHPLEKKSISLRERPPSKALGRSKSKGKELAADLQGKLATARIPKAPEKPALEGVKAPKKPAAGKGKRKGPKTNYVMGKPPSI